MKNPPADVCTHVPGTNRGEEWLLKGKHEAGRGPHERTARDSTSVNPKGREPIDARMPHMPPA